MKSEKKFSIDFDKFTDSEYSFNDKVVLSG